MGGGGVAHDKGTVNGNGNEARRFTDKLLMPLPMPMPIFGIQVAPSSPLPISNSSGSSSGRTVVSSSLNSSKSGSGSLSSPAKSDAPPSPLTAVTTITTTGPRLERFPSLEGWGKAPLAGTCVWTLSVDADGCETGSYMEDEQCREIYKREEDSF
jgi:hypothetical protein